MKALSLSPSQVTTSISLPSESCTMLFMVRSCHGLCSSGLYETLPVVINLTHDVKDFKFIFPRRNKCVGMVCTLQRDHAYFLRFSSILQALQAFSTSGHCTGMITKKMLSHNQRQPVASRTISAIQSTLVHCKGRLTGTVAIP